MTAPAAVEVTVPATSANLGPGFDCLGVALGLGLRVRLSPSEKSRISGKGRVRSVEDSLIFRSVREAFAAAAAGAPAVHIEVLDDYPSARGLGASASAIVAGLAGANALGGLMLTQQDLARLAIRIEGHADNVLPALFGGLILSVGDDWIRLVPTQEISPIVLVARSSFKTETARRVLPGTISRRDAVANAAAASALVAVLTGSADPGDLLHATADALHEPYRLPLMPETLELHKSLRERQIPTALSGAGPSLICLVASADVEECARVAQTLAPDGWQVVKPGWDLEGARLEQG